MNKLLNTQCLVYGINSIVDEGATIELSEIQKLVETKEIINFMQKKFKGIELLSIRDDNKETIEIELHKHSNLFDSDYARKKFGITKNGYIMLSSALVSLMQDNIL